MQKRVRCAAAHAVALGELPACGPLRPVDAEIVDQLVAGLDRSLELCVDHLSEMVKKNIDFVVYDAKTNEDITRSVLTQIIFEEESQGQSLLPIQFCAS